MKILFTSFSYIPERSGIPIVVQSLAEGLAARGHDVSVFTCMNHLKAEESEVINGVNVRRFKMGLTTTKRKWGDVGGYINSVKNAYVDILIMECLQCHTTDFLFPILPYLKCKVFIHAHGAPGLTMKPFSWDGTLKNSIGHFHNWLRWKQYYKTIFPKYSQFILGSISSCLCASDIAFLSKCIKNNYVLENSTCDIFFKPEYLYKDTTKILNLKSKRYIVNIANYSDRKNQALLIDSFAKAKIDDCALVIIGTAKNWYYQKLVKQVEEIKKTRNIEIVLLDKDVSRENFPSILKHAALCAMTSKWEEYSISLVETMAVGTAFLSTQAGNAHILPGGVTARNKDELPVLIKLLLSNPKQLQKYGMQGKEYALNNNRQNVILSNLEEILQS